MRCAVPSCSGHCTSRNWLGVGDRCSRPAPFDPTGARISSDHFDEAYPGAQDELDRRHLDEAAAPP